ncbi:hypothetical protein M527_17090 [Sphingobium indicum IP26]|nr:hypothetical protein M527_17090 [Sphingobium indicum IP26]
MPVVGSSSGDAAGRGGSADHRMGKRSLRGGAMMQGEAAITESGSAVR